MSTKSICLHPWEMQALLDGRLKQVRRPVKPQPNNELSWIGWMTDTTGNKKDISSACWAKDYDCILVDSYYVKPPYAVGDVVAVKETYCDLGDGSMPGRILYKATFDGLAEEMMKKSGHGTPIWRSPATMPLWAVRLSRVITGVRVERVQEISEGDAIKCGIEYLFTQEECDTTAGLIGTKQEEHGYKNYLWHGEHGLTKKQVDSWDHQFSDYTSAKGSYSSLWQRYYPRYPWESNPWVFVYEVGEVKG